MALSNWDTAAWDERGHPCNGFFTYKGVTLSIYKNWVRFGYEAKADGLKLDVPVTGSINEGKMSINGIDVLVKRGEHQESVFVAVRVWHDVKHVNAMFGIGCYGYDDDEFVGVKGSTLREFRLWLKDVVAEEFSVQIPVFEKEVRFNQGDAYFASKFNSPIPKTNVGEAGDSILSKSLRGIKGKEE